MLQQFLNSRAIFNTFFKAQPQGIPKHRITQGIQVDRQVQAAKGFNPGVFAPRKGSIGMGHVVHPLVQNYAKCPDVGFEANFDLQLATSLLNT